jgi:hypothetical protein
LRLLVGKVGVVGVTIRLAIGASRQVGEDTTLPTTDSRSGGQLPGEERQGEDTAKKMPRLGASDRLRRKNTVAVARGRVGGRVVLKWGRGSKRGEELRRMSAQGLAKPHMRRWHVSSELT